MIYFFSNKKGYVIMVYLCKYMFCLKYPTVYLKEKI